MKLSGLSSNKVMKKSRAVSETAGVGKRWPSFKWYRCWLPVAASSSSGLPEEDEDELEEDDELLSDELEDLHLSADVGTISALSA